MRIAVVGGSAAGLFAALLLARAGYEITVLDRETLDAAPDVEAAAEAAFRPGAPHIVQPHALLPLCRALLMRHLPDVYTELLAAGVQEAPFATQIPPSLPDRSERPGDERFTFLMTRRATFDWVLRRIAARQDRVTLRGEVRALGLTADPGRPPHVTGVRTSSGTLRADLVIDATGRRSAIDRWLTELGSPPTVVDRAECGLTYFSRHYRLTTAEGLPGPRTTRIVAGLPEFVAGIWGSDNDVVQVLIAPLTEDKRFRAVTDPDVFAAVLRTVPFQAAWLDVMEPFTPVFPMAGLHNTMRRCVVDEAAPAGGLVALGDTVCTTNPTLGRGLSLALRSAAQLAAAVAEHGEDPAALAAAVDRSAQATVRPFYDDQADSDAARLAVMRQEIFGVAAPPAREDPERITLADLRAASLYDADVLRSIWEVLGMLRLPDEIYTDPRVVTRTREVLRDLPSAPTIPGPSREQLAHALAG